MKAVLFDAFSGAGGDMIVASLLGISLKKEDLEEIIDSLGLTIEFNIERVKINGVKVNMLNVKSKSNIKIIKRKYSEVVDLIGSSKLSEDVKKRTLSIFERIAKAEGVIHGRDYKDAVFHEVGSDDAIFDVVSSVTGIVRLLSKGYRFFSTPIMLGSGFVKCIHGKLPVPAPATLEILKNSKVEVIFDGENELLTPTAAAILAEFVEGELKYPISIEEIGYSCGSITKSLFRTILCKVILNDCISIIETNIDDVSGEIIAYAVEKLMRLGALDVTIIPALSKKGRISFVLRLLCECEKSEEFAESVMAETGSSGVRIIPVYHRVKSIKNIESKDFEFNGKKFKVRIKNTGVNIKPEFEDVKKVAENTGLPIVEIYREIYKNL